MINRKFWLKKIRELWRKRSIIWLAGVRRAGKTFLCKSLDDIEYFDCELPSVRRRLEDPEDFLKNLENKKIILDEIHRLDNPSELLKIAADHYPEIKIIATGSSTLSASKKFKDTLTNRKFELWLTPMISDDLINFEKTNLEHRLKHGGIPPFFLSNKLPEAEFQEWMDSFWAKDIQELFRLNKRSSFQKFFEMLMVQSGGIFTATSFASACGVSHTTIANYLKVLEVTFAMHVIKPFSKNKNHEIIAAPKVYGFDTGFVAYYCGWDKLRDKDKGILWEHYVLNEMHAKLQTRKIFYWRDKRNHEIDFILSNRGRDPITIEAKILVKDFDPTNLIAFRNHYPEGRNFVVASDVEKSYVRYFSNIRVQFINFDFIENLI